MSFLNSLAIAVFLTSTMACTFFNSKSDDGKTGVEETGSEGQTYSLEQEGLPNLKSEYPFPSKTDLISWDELKSRKFNAAKILWKKAGVATTSSEQVTDMGALLKPFADRLRNSMAAEGIERNRPCSGGFKDPMHNIVYLSGEIERNFFPTIQVEKVYDPSSETGDEYDKSETEFGYTYMTRLKDVVRGGHPARILKMRTLFKSGNQAYSFYTDTRHNLDPQDRSPFSQKVCLDTFDLSSTKMVRSCLRVRDSFERPDFLDDFQWNRYNSEVAVTIDLDTVYQETLNNFTLTRWESGPWNSLKENVNIKKVDDTTFDATLIRENRNSEGEFHNTLTVKADISDPVGSRCKVTTK